MFFPTDPTRTTDYLREPEWVPVSLRRKRGAVENPLRSEPGRGRELLGRALQPKREDAATASFPRS
jgi:hypothetical protein